MRSGLAGGAALLAGCSPLEILNGLVPSGNHRTTADIAYGRDARQRLDVYQPAADVRGAPVVVFFYGGAWNNGSRTAYVFAGEALASQGFVAVLPDYRLYPQVRFPAFLDDCAQATRWTVDHIERFGGNADTIFLMGHSAGAYNAAMLALNPVYLRDAGVEPKRVRGLIGLAGPYDFLPLQGRVTKGVFGFPDTPRATQPIHFATGEAPPALLATGGLDDIVDPGNSARLAQRLRERGASVTQIVYPDLGHRTILGALAAPLRRLGPVLDDLVGFVRRRA